MADGSFLESDEFFALQMRRAGNVILAVPEDLTPPPLFLTNALALGDISTRKDYLDGNPAPSAGVSSYAANGTSLFAKLRRTRNSAWTWSRRGWNPARWSCPAAARTTSTCRWTGRAILIWRILGATSCRPGMARKAKPFTEERLWHMGVVLAAQELKLDLAKAEVDLKQGRITLRGAGGVERIIPVDADGCFYIDWCLPPNDPQLTQEAIQGLLLAGPPAAGRTDQ